MEEEIETEEEIKIKELNDIEDIKLLNKNELEFHFFTEGKSPKKVEIKKI